MINIQRILCPTDLSSESDEALRYAVALTHAYDANLLLLHCTEITAWNRESESRHAGVDMACTFEHALINHLGLAELRSLKWQALAIDNVKDIGQAIGHQAAKYKADLIVMRSRRRPHAAALLGSTAETVSRTAPCPVLVTHPGEREWVGLSTGEIDLRRVLVAHDFSLDSRLALSYGLALAQEYQAEEHLLHVINSGEQEEPERAWSQGVESPYASVALQLQQAVPTEALLWCNLVTAVRYGKPYEEVIAYADEHEIDLICIGASGSHFSMEALFGSNVDRVLRRAHCPVLVARPITPAKVRSSHAAETSALNHLQQRRDHDPTGMRHQARPTIGDH